MIPVRGNCSQYFISISSFPAYDIATSFPKIASKIKLVTFSGPRVASVELAQEIDKKVKDHIRIFTDGDLVPSVPLYLGQVEKGSAVCK